MKTKATQRALSFALAIMMIVSILPLGIISAYAYDATAEVITLSGKSDSYNFTAGSWNISETTHDGKASQLTTTDGMTFTDVSAGPSGDGKSFQSRGGTITTVDKFNLSGGFSFSITLNQYGTSGNKWGDAVILDFSAFQVVLVGSYNSSSNTKYYIGSGYTSIGNGNPTFETLYGSYDTGILIRNGSAANAEQLASLNTTFEVIYRDGKASLYVESMKSDTNSLGIVTWTVGDTTATEIAIDSVNLAEVNIKLQKNWSYVDDLNVFKNITLTGVDAEHAHIFVDYVYNNDRTCTQDGTKTAVCSVDGCEETDTIVAEGTAGHEWGEWVEDTENNTKTRICSVCGETEKKVLVITPEVDVEYDFNSASWDMTEAEKLTTEDGKTFTDVSNGSNGPSFNSNGGKITTVDPFNLSGGFSLSVTLNQYGTNGNKWGDAAILDFSAFQIVLAGSYGTNDSRHTNTIYYIGSGYSTISNGVPTFETLYGKYDTGKGIYNGTTPTSEELATLNTTFEVVYKNGKVSLCVESMKSDTNALGIVTWTVGETTATEIAIDSASLAKVNISLQKRWSYVDDLNVLKDITLKGVKSTEEPETGIAAPEFEGCQDATVDGKLNVRFVGTINTTDYSGIGFDIEAAAYSKAWNIDTTIVYAKIVGSIDTGVTEEYTAESFGAQYIYAATICGIPTTGTVEFTVTTYGTLLDGTKVTGDTYTVTYTDGVFVSINPAIA